MKFEFNTRQYQEKVIQSTINLFDGQPTFKNKLDNSFSHSLDTIFKNSLVLTDEKILENLKSVQRENHREDAPIKVSETLDKMDYSIEMETGTGKTFVYLRTIVNLAKTYGWKKYIIVVPSVAIKEGVKTEFDRLKNELESKIKQPISLTSYESQNINELDTYYRSNMVEILLMTMQSFNSDNNILNRNDLDLEVGKPIKLIQELRPIVLLDEPQKMGGEATKKGLANFNPLFTLRYSATHKDLVNPIFRYTPVDAYNDGYVKKIEVLSVYGNQEVDVISYIEVQDIGNDRNGEIYAKLKFHRSSEKGIKLTTRKLNLGKDLYELSNHMIEYKGYKISSINLRTKSISFENGVTVSEQSVSQNKDDIMKIQIKETIKTHLDKELNFASKGIKVLSLFFIDKVINYRDPQDSDFKGKIRKWFEEAYSSITSESKYTQFSVANLDNVTDFDDIQAAYFSKDKTGYKDTSGNTKKFDDETYNLIMRDKERLLSFENPIRFIFSHSALREGWDNPNIFQICTLNETVSDIKKRQEIGRGLRLPVNQEGKRITEDDYRILTVTANASYESFAKELQQEISEDTGIVTSSAPIEDARARKKIQLNEEAFDNPDFINLWNRINKKTTYHINIENDEIITSIVSALTKTNFTVELPNIIIKKTIMDSYIDADKNRTVTDSKTVQIDQNRRIPNVIKKIADNTGLTKRNIIDTIRQSHIEKYIFVNPEQFVEKITNIINNELPKILKKGIKYENTGEVYELSLFKKQIEVYTNNKLLSPKLIQDGQPIRTLYDLVQLDSENELNLIEEFNANVPNFKFFIKLPSWFTVRTPVGKYNPDWALVYEHNGSEKLYLMRESKKTKGKYFSSDELRLTESLKIEYGKKHFDEISVDFQVVENIEDIKDGVYPFNKPLEDIIDQEKEEFIKEKIESIKSFEIPYEKVKEKYINEFTKYNITEEVYQNI
ncbi:DEAD/DEAH box helicase family protein [Carnobacterium maltaromaticum]|uniref:restriction endonuclease n=1 Tax=Carnobacterium maltaromaticum TaxID=2751 RepID=UPI00298A929F|nr:DEAD/DEAH box helicase family protein [Carnobacterium maltaromaticum]MDW5525316.1 DEAD/DEAH box helicase family protein [Carnobacterium maltaromaticum]